MDGPQSEKCQPRGTLPPAASDWLQDTEEQVRARIADRLRGTPDAYLLTTDEDSGQDKPTQASERRRSKGVSGKLRTADTTVIHQVTWPIEVIYSHSAQPVICDQHGLCGQLHNSYVQRTPTYQNLHADPPPGAHGGWGTHWMASNHCFSIGTGPGGMG